MILDTLCFSIYSDMSTRIMDPSVPKTASASALEISVFPTPVGPKNRKYPIGRLGSFKPTLPRRTAFATAVTASSCPMTRLWRMDSNFRSLADSYSASRFTGIFVHWATTSATSFSPTSARLRFMDFLAFLRSFSYSACSSSFSLRSAEAAFSSSIFC